jgi:hypothetical protein
LILVDGQEVDLSLLDPETLQIYQQLELLKKRFSDEGDGHSVLEESRKESPPKRQRGTPNSDSPPGTKRKVESIFGMEMETGENQSVQSLLQQVQSQGERGQSVDGSVPPGLPRQFNQFVQEPASSSAPRPTGQQNVQEPASSSAPRPTGQDQDPDPSQSTGLSQSRPAGQGLGNRLVDDPRFVGTPNSTISPVITDGTIRDFAANFC